VALGMTSRMGQIPYMSRELTKVSVVVPAHNEQANIPVLLEQLTTVLKLYADFEIIVVDDGSTDQTVPVLMQAAAQNPHIKYVVLSRNFGHQAALRAGLSYATGDCIVSMDADLQHPVAMLSPMVENWRSGYDIVATLRQDPQDGKFIKNVTSRAFYKFLNWLSDVEVAPGSADFRLVDRKVLDVINQLTESDFFLRGLVPWLGFRTIQIPYTPDARRHGTTKYNMKRMISLGLAGIVSHSIRPLRLSALFAALIASLVGLYSIYAVTVYFTSGQTVPGWTSVILAVSLIGALQLLVLGVIGEYLGRTLREARKRPNYIVSDTNCLARVV
jgi:polyisoprenyl-phosphate glycosyltransferase